MKKLLTIFFLLPVLVQAQGFVAKSAGTGTWKGIGTPGFVMRFKLPTPAPSASFLPTSYTNVNSQNPNAGSTQSGVLTFANLTSAVTIAVSLPLQFSINGGLTYVNSASVSTGSPLSLLIREAPSQSAQSVSQNMTITGSGISLTIGITGTIIPAPSASMSPSSITALNSTNPLAGSTQPSVLTFANLIGSITLATAFPVEFSIDGGLTWTNSTTVSSGSPLTIQFREAASQSAQSVSQNFTYTGTGISGSLPITGTISAAATATVGNVKLYDSVRSNNGLFINTKYNFWAPTTTPSVVGLTSRPLLDTNGVNTGITATVGNMNDHATNVSSTFGNTNTMGYPGAAFQNCIFGTAGTMTLRFDHIPTGKTIIVKFGCTTDATGGGSNYLTRITNGSFDSGNVQAFNNLGTLITSTAITPVSGTTTFTFTGSFEVLTFFTFSIQ